MKSLKQLRECQAGAALVEFALVAPVFIAMIFGIIEASRVFWIKQTLDEVAYSTARCMSVNSMCDGAGAPEAYAIDRARGYAIGLVPGDIDAESEDCMGPGTHAYLVEISKDIGSPLGGLIPQMPSTLTASACFPTLS